MAVIELPSFAVPSQDVSIAFVDAGFIQRGIQSDDYIPRKGGRYRLGFTFGPYDAERTRVMAARLVAGKQGGIRVKLPLLHNQGTPGSPTVAFASGRTLALQGLTANYVIREGFWLSLVKSGRHFLHSVGVGATADGGGSAEIELNELLRDTFAPGSAVHLAAPQIEGLIEGDEAAWVVPRGRRSLIQFTVKEAR